MVNHERKPEMTTNQERAADVIDRWSRNGGELNSHVGNPDDLAQALADAGLLMPDLPEPHGLSGRLKFWDHEMHSVTIHPHFGLRLIAEQSDTELTPAEARLIANSLYSAAKHAEQEQGNDGEKKYTVRYYNPIMGVYETHWDTQEEAEKEAAYDHGMNGAPTRVLDPDGNEIATFEEGQRHV